MILRLAFKNTLGAGLRTWLNVIVLSIAYVLIIGMQGLYRGMNDQASQARISQELGGGQYWHPQYDPYDPMTLDEAHGIPPSVLTGLVEAGMATPILCGPAAIFPEGRIRSVLLRGIEPDQQILDLPTAQLHSDHPLPIMLGARMAASVGVQVGDELTVRWRDSNGTFDAADAEVVYIFKSRIPTIDVGQIWLPLQRMQTMLAIPGQATMVVLQREGDPPESTTDWSFRDLDYLLMELKAMVRSKSVGGGIMQGLLLAIALLAIFDSQILSLFRRRREMGTLISLGMTRGNLIGLFTAEGALHGIMAMLLGTLYGLPLLTWLALTGIPLPGYSDDWGFALSDRLFPVYGPLLVLISTLIVFISVTVISYIPVRRIASLDPTEALRGKVS